MKYLQERSEDDEQSANWSLLESQVTKLFKRIPDYGTLLGLYPELMTRTKYTINIKM